MGIAVERERAAHLRRSIKYRPPEQEKERLDTDRSLYFSSLLISLFF